MQLSLSFWNRTGSVAAAISSPPASTIKPRQRDRFQSRHSRQCNATPSRADKRRINELPNDGQDSAPSAIDQLGKNPLGIRTCTETSSGSKATRGGGDGGGGDPFDGDEDDGVASAQSEGRWEHPKWLTELYNSKREMIKAANGSGANRSTNCCMVGFRPKLVLAGLKCHNCQQTESTLKKGVLRRDGFIDRPRRACDLNNSVFLIGVLYRCNNKKCNKKCRSWSPEVLNQYFERWKGNNERSEDD
ncbi:BZ3500_MvSof-1268-A1-R1_Chr8-2g10252 [Microbotryum saponariae]|uniref:BZ3500_MvSof-1268-A1-R1_Chr8-2g10252 protein n=1 Tax=Microbotryum saponariae TaxID=289078 RepID=A0A2X0LAG8_9BASI|nr:BZ3500_MvSof-1268-A1-R1_Chr8-2g10252 [Microbotryum saponariae]SDA02050.1 BZ3501_MvSof-1269-A2-R1_Chr8-2g10002 [Microbotryum saponariae]